MIVAVTGCSPHLLTANSRIGDVIWRHVQKSFPEHVGVFFDLSADSCISRCLPLPRGVAAAVNFGAFCESAKPDLVISFGDDADAAHVAACRVVGIHDFGWLHILNDCERHVDRPYESCPLADAVIACSRVAANQAARSGVKNIQVSTPSTALFSQDVHGAKRGRYFFAPMRNFESNNFSYLLSEWEKSGLSDGGWELVIGTNGADPGDFDLGRGRLPAGSRQAWAASSVEYGVDDLLYAQTLAGAWAAVFPVLCPSSAVSVVEAVKFGVDSVVTDCPVFRALGCSHLLPSVPFMSAPGKLLHIPVPGALAETLVTLSSLPEPSRPCDLANAPSHLDIFIKLLPLISRREARKLDVESVTPL